MDPPHLGALSSWLSPREARKKKRPKRRGPADRRIYGARAAGPVNATVPSPESGRPSATPPSRLLTARVRDTRSAPLVYAGVFTATDQPPRAGKHSSGQQQLYGVTEQERLYAEGPGGAKPDVQISDQVRDADRVDQNGADGHREQRS